MSNEIVPIRDGSEAPPYSADSGNHSKATKRHRRRPHGHGSRHLEDVPLFDSLGLSRPANAELNFYLIGANHHSTHFFPRHLGHIYVTQSIPSLASVKPLLEEMKEPSVLWLRGCDQLLLHSQHFPFARFKTLTALEISDVAHLTTLPKEISEMTTLQTLSLSHLPIQQFPANELLCKLTNLRSFILKSCSNLRFLPQFPRLPALDSLVLSDLLVETLPDGFFSNTAQLRRLVLRGCSRLRCLPPSFKPLTPLERSLEVLDLSHCIALQDLHLDHSKLKVLDLSYTNLRLTRNPFGPIFNLTHVFCRHAKGSVFKTVLSAYLVQVLDLSGAQILNRNVQLKTKMDLQALDLSRTRIKSVEFMKKPATSLSILLLRECSSLVKLPTTKSMPNLEVLDISGCGSLLDLPEDLCELKNLKELNLSRCTSLRGLREGLFDQMSCLEKLDISETNFNHLPSSFSFSNLINLGTKLILSQNLFSNLENKHLLNLEVVEVVASPGSNDEIEAENHRVISSNISNKPNEIHLVSTFTGTKSPFYRFKHKFTQVKDLILEIQQNNDVNLNAASSADATPKQSNVKRHLGRMAADLEYILRKIDFLESSDNDGNVWNLLQELMYAVEHLKADDFPLYSAKLNKLFRVVAKLKLLVPHGLKPQEESSSNKDKKDPRLTWTNKDDEEKEIAAVDDDDDDDDYINREEQRKQKMLQNLHIAYDSLTETQRQCLLYFAIFTPKSLNIEIKKRSLIHLWYGERFIDTAQNVGASSSTQLTPTTETAFLESTGLQILKVLEGKGFTLLSPDNGIYLLHPVVHSFVREQAKAESFFNFDNDQNCRLTPHLTSSSKRACLLESRSNLPSSSQLWLNYTINSAHSKKLESCFKNVRTLVNGNERVIDIRAEWFSMMTSLSVLHLGSWDTKTKKHNEVVDLKFLDELRKMNELRVLSLEGVAAIKKLPDSSISKLANLKILNLRECSDLQELPAGIGSLKSLIHLDLTDCPLLPMLPKGIELLTKLEVLKGFVITYDAQGRQNQKACELGDLFKLEKLRKLSLVVNIDKFPNSEDLNSFKKMKNLCNLRITWLLSNYIDQDAIRPKESRRSRWQRLKCWEQQIRQQNDETEEPLRSNRGAFDNLYKLVLCCFPSETAPNWLQPAEFQKLQILYIKGGHLKTLLPPGDPNNQNPSWSVKALGLNHTLKLNMDWSSLMSIFPNLIFFKKLPDGYLSTFPVNVCGEWRKRS